MYLDLLNLFFSLLKNPFFFGFSFSSTIVSSEFISVASFKLTFFSLIFLIINCSIEFFVSSLSSLASSRRALINYILNI